MEWVRSCFTSKWKLFRGSPRLRAGYYYFAAHGTPHYPGTHNLGSRDWVSDNGFEDALLGEWAGSRAYYRGDPPEVIPLALLVGDKDCIKKGENPELPGFPDSCERGGILLPLPCYSKIALLEKKTNVWDCAFAFKLANILATQYDDVVEAGTQLADFLGEDATVTPFPQVGTLIPNCLVAVDLNLCLVTITGTTNFQQLALQGLYFGLGPSSQGSYSASQLYEDAATQMAYRITAAGGAECTRFVLVGHSYGGAICHVLAAKIRVNNPSRRVELVTFGSPKPGDDRLRDIVLPMKQTNWVNEGDPVPYLPPVGATFAELSGLVPLLLFGFWRTYERPGSVVVLDADGTIERTDSAKIEDSILLAVMVTIAASGTPEPFSAHKLSHYATRLRAGCMHICGDTPPPIITPADFFYGHITYDDGSGGSFVEHNYSFVRVDTGVWTEEGNPIETAFWRIETAEASGGPPAGAILTLKAAFPLGGSVLVDGLIVQLAVDWADGALHDADTTYNVSPDDFDPAIAFRISADFEIV